MTIAGLDYWRCETCAATFLDRRHWPSAADERAHYLTHENAIDDPDYRRFLSKVSQPLLGRLKGPSEGLDFGCGPGSALAAMLREAGHKVTLYDPFFHPDPAALATTYDFITSTEVIEHLHDPAATFDHLDTLLRPGGWLGLMTIFQTDDDRFATWRYRQDPTHVVFYRAETLRLIAGQRGWRCEIPVKDVALMQKQSER